MVEYDKKFAIMEMERNGKVKDAFVDKMLQETSSPFSPRVEAYRLLEKFKALPMMSYKALEIRLST